MRERGLCGAPERRLPEGKTCAPGAAPFGGETEEKVREAGRSCEPDAEDE